MRVSCSVSDLSSGITEAGSKPDPGRSTPPLTLALVTKYDMNQPEKQHPEAPVRSACSITELLSVLGLLLKLAVVAFSSAAVLALALRTRTRLSSNGRRWLGALYALNIIGHHASAHSFPPVIHSSESLSFSWLHILLSLIFRERRALVCHAEINSVAQRSDYRTVASWRRRWWGSRVVASAHIRGHGHSGAGVSR